MPAALHIRTATREDLPAVVALLADDVLGASREELTHPLHGDYLAAFEAIAANPYDAQVVAVLDARVVACLQLTFLPGLSHRGAWRGQVEGVRVASDLRGQGIGRELLAWTVARCRERSCRTVQLTSNAARTEAQRFYRSLGFTTSHFGMKLEL